MLEVDKVEVDQDKVEMEIVASRDREVALEMVEVDKVDFGTEVDLKTAAETTLTDLALVPVDLEMVVDQDQVDLEMVVDQDKEMVVVDQDHKVDLHLVNSIQDKEEIGGQGDVTNQYTFLLTILEWS